MLLPLLLFFQAAASPDGVIKAATRYFPGVMWQAESIITADFTCAGRKQAAILGATKDGVVVAMFSNGIDKRPEAFRDDVHHASLARLEIEDLDYDPEKEDPGYVLPGFRRSKTCKGLTVIDDQTDPLHLYWDHKARRFGYWSH